MTTQAMASAPAPQRLLSASAQNAPIGRMISEPIRYPMKNGPETSRVVPLSCTMPTTSCASSATWITPSMPSNVQLIRLSRAASTTANSAAASDSATRNQVSGANTG